MTQMATKMTGRVMRCAKPSGATEQDVQRLLKDFCIREMVSFKDCQ